MSCDQPMLTGPFGLDAEKGQTCGYQRTVLVVVHHLTAATRLADVVPLLEPDRRVQVVFTCPPASVFARGTPEFVAGLGGVVVPWCQATQVPFDLAVAAGYGMLEQVHAPVLTLPHGVGFGKYMNRWASHGPLAEREGAGAVRARLVYHGRVVPSAVVVATDAHLAHLTRSCPEAAPVAVLAGDPCYDRLAASLDYCAAYRSALGVAGRKLVVVSSTWGPGSLLGQHPGLLPRLAAELPHSQYQVVAVLHPNIWAWHGRRQLRAWYAGCAQHGVMLLAPEEGWRAALAAADWVIGDSGSVSCYAAAAGVPVLLASFPGQEVEPGSPAAALDRLATRLCLDQAVEPQLGRAAAAWPAGAWPEMAAQVTSVPGQAAGLIREVMYRLMRLPEPEELPVVAPVPPPPVRLAGQQAYGEARWRCDR